MGMVAAVVVGEVLLRGGEAGSVVPTKVPGNLESGGHVSVPGSHTQSHVPPEHQGSPPQRPGDPSYSHGSLGAGSMKGKGKRGESERFRALSLTPPTLHLRNCSQVPKTRARTHPGRGCWPTRGLRGRAPAGSPPTCPVRRGVSWLGRRLLPEGSGAAQWAWEPRDPSGHLPSCFCKSSMWR